MVILVFPDEKPVFLREQGARMYGVLPYFLAKITSDLPIVALGSLLQTAIYYFALKLNTESADKYFIHFGYHFLLS